MAGCTLGRKAGRMWADVEGKCWDVLNVRRCRLTTNQTCREQSASLSHIQLLTRGFLYDTSDYLTKIKCQLSPRETLKMTEWKDGVFFF